jgi:hypothetical protein
MLASKASDQTRGFRRSLWFKWGAVTVLSFLPSVGLLVMQHQEDVALRGYLSAKGLLGAPVTWHTAIEVSQAVRADFEVRADHWREFDPSHRPFLRHDSMWLLRVREGLCGEGTRVLVDLLNELGFDATRITLYDRYFGPEHTLASVVIDGEERFVDSINSTELENTFLRENVVAIRDFPILHYGEQTLERREPGGSRGPRSQGAGEKWFFDTFRAYSYEAIPVTKLLAILGLDSHVLMLRRPGHFISQLAEKPRALEALVLTAAALCLHGAIATTVAIRRCGWGPRR